MRKIGLLLFLIVVAILGVVIGFLLSQPSGGVSSQLPGQLPDYAMLHAILQRAPSDLPFRFLREF